MRKKLVDVFDGKGKLLHSYPIVLGGLNYEPTEQEFIEQALKSAKDDNLVSEKDYKTLRARIR